MRFFCGDPRGRLEHILSVVREHYPAAIVLLGDLRHGNRYGNRGNWSRPLHHSNPGGQHRGLSNPA